MPQSKAVTSFIEEHLGYTFNDEQLAIEAISSPGSAYGLPEEGNRKLALVGDAVLDLVIIQTWFNSRKSIGAGMEEKARLVSNQRLERVARACKLVELVRVSPSQKGIQSGLQLATAVKALIGAVWQDTDRDFGRVVGLVEHLYKQEKESGLKSDESDIKMERP